ncbi:MAG: hypothetical protein JJT94_10055 [Bernardetiaceae bacterium]|nr:hypothetical protein [Bernardetiaceae bacterium]
MSDIIQITVAHLKKAVDARDADLLDKMLSINKSQINYKSAYTDSWGEWWGFLMEAVLNSWEDGVRVLLKHGAKRKQGAWGDGLNMTPIEVAEEKNNQNILKLLKTQAKLTYERKTDPEIPPLDEQSRRINEAQRIANETGLMFQTPDPTTED